MENQILAKESLDGKVKMPFWVSSVQWYKVSCMPAEDQAIVYVTTNNKIGRLANTKPERWDWYVEKYSIVGWCYSEDLLPKGGEL